MKRRAITFGALILLACPWVSEAQAQIVLKPRTYVSSAGSDSNACSITAPCRSFSGAAAKTAARGEITALDTATYGDITISKALTIQAAPGAHAVLGTASSTTPVVVSAGESDVVVMRNLHITRAGTSSATRGVQFNSGGALHIEGCVVAGFSDTGIYGHANVTYANGTGPRLFVNDTTVRGNGTGIGIGSILASINRSRIENNATGVSVDTQVIGVTISDSLLAGNSDYGLRVTPITVTTVETCVVTNNGTGIFAAGGLDDALKSTIYISHTMISNNNHGVAGNGNLYSFGNNRLANNDTNGAFTSTIDEQ